ncbi:MAG TPA: acyl-CoA dehydrogenase C-terminal domain-containing protein, partial [Amaricoccus sp.]|nr:acyl-CoA dehydrogenase C-terminal domain-containing protein [Amaricoccus sp.]
GCEVTSLAMQVFGGMGYIEETGIAQFWRDVRVTAIYEGTNGIQAMDLVGRKLADGGAAAQKLIEAVAETAIEVAGDLGARLAAAARRLAETTGWMAAAEANDRAAGAVPYLRAFALTLGGWHLLRAAAAEGDEAGPRAALAAFHVRQMLPQVPALCDAAVEGAAPLYAGGIG